MLPEARGLEFLIIAAIALIVVGPKELPNLLRKLGQFVGKMRRIAADFRTSFDEMAKQSELDDLRKQVEEMRAQASSATDPLGMNNTMGEINASLQAEHNHGVIPDEFQAPEVPPAPEPEIVTPARKRAPKPKADLAKPPAKKAAAKPASKASPAKTPAKKRAAPKIVS